MQHQRTAPAIGTTQETRRRLADMRRELAALAGNRTLNARLRRRILLNGIRTAEAHTRPLQERIAGTREG